MYDDDEEQEEGFLQAATGKPCGCDDGGDSPQTVTVGGEEDKGPREEEEETEVEGDLSKPMIFCIAAYNYSIQNLSLYSCSLASSLFSFDDAVLSFPTCPAHEEVTLLRAVTSAIGLQRRFVAVDLLPLSNADLLETG